MSAAIDTEVVFANPIDAHLNAFFVDLLDAITSEKERKLVQSLHQTLLQQNQIASVVNTIEFEKQKAPSPSPTCAEMLKLDDKDVWNTMAQQLKLVEDFDLFPHCKGKIEDLPL
jgi:hypothetical protein